MQSETTCLCAFKLYDGAHLKSPVHLPLQDNTMKLRESREVYKNGGEKKRASLTFAWKWIPCWYASSLWRGTLESATSSTRLYLFLAGIASALKDVAVDLTTKQRGCHPSVKTLQSHECVPRRSERDFPRRRRSPLLLLWAPKAVQGDTPPSLFFSCDRETL